jgi:hypothetical protein
MVVFAHRHGSPKLEKEGYEVVDWIQLAQDMDRWQAFFLYGNTPSGSIYMQEKLLSR